MPMFGPWQDSVERLFGVHRTSGDRTPEEQQHLVNIGATRAGAHGGPHTIPDNAIDLPIRMNSAQAQARLDAAGVPGYALYESGQGPNQGTGPHVHIQQNPLRHSTVTSASSTDWNLSHYQTDTPGGHTVATNPDVQAGRAILSPAELDSLATSSHAEGDAPAYLDSPSNPLVPTPVPATATGRGTSAGSPVLNPFQVGPELERRAQALDATVAGQEAFLNRQDAEMATLQANRRAETADYVRQAQAVNTTAEEGNRALLAATNPLLQRSEAINNRLAELATMNPLERGIRGIFDLRYNTGYLERTREQLHTALADASSRYQFVSTLQDQFLHHLEVGHQLHGVDDALKLTELDETGHMLAGHMANAMASLDSLKSGVQANSQVIQAQSLARSTLLDTMDAPQINSMLEQAQAHGGEITVQGIPIPASELHIRAMNWDRLNTDLQNAHVALQANQAQLVEQNARRMVTHMSLGQLQEAARNGGTFNGITLPSDALTEAIGGYARRQQYETSMAMQAGGGQTAGQALQGTFQLMHDTVDRFRGVGTTGNNRFEMEAAPVFQEITRLSNQLIEANRNGTADAVAPAILERLNTLRQGFDARIANYAGRLAGGAPITTRVMTSYLTGQPINSDEAAQSMLEMYDRGGLPTTMRASPTFQTAYQLTARAAEMVDSQHAPGSGHEVNAAERSRLILNLAHSMRLPDQVNNANMEQLFGAASQIARSMNHPFGRVDPNEVARAQQLGNQDGYERIAGDLGSNVATIQAMDRGNWTPPQGMTTEQANTLRQRFEQVRGQLATLQQSAFLQHLDEGPSAQGNFQPSRAYIDLINSNGFIQRAHQFEQTQSNYSFGDAIASSMGGGTGLVQSVAQYGAHMRSIHVQRERELASDSRNGFQAYTTVPQVRTRMILGAIPGIDQSEENQLLAHLRTTVPGFDVPNPNGNQQVRDFIVGQQFRDPNLERIRRIAARAWDQTAETQDRAMSRMAWSNTPLIGGIVNRITAQPGDQ